MSCDLISGRLIGCIDAKPGIDDFYLIPRTSLGADAFTISGNEVTGLDVLITEVFKYQLRGDDENIFTQTNPDDGRATGAKVFEQSFVVKLKKVDKATSAELAIVGKSVPNVVVKDNEGFYRLMGLSEGCYSVIEENSGGAKNSFSGYTLTFTATEFDSAPFLDSDTITALEALVSATNITP